MKIDWQKIKELNRTGLKDTMFPGYNFNKWIFRSALLICFAIVIIIMASEGFDFETKVYFRCPDGGPICENPFNSSLMNPDNCPDPDFCSIERFYPGETYGRPPSGLMKSAGPLFFGVWGLAFIVNHLAFNWRRKHGK